MYPGSGNANVPAMNTAWPYYYSGASRLVSGKFSPSAAVHCDRSWRPRFRTDSVKRNKPDPSNGSGSAIGQDYRRLLRAGGVHESCRVQQGTQQSGVANAFFVNLGSYFNNAGTGPATNYGDYWTTGPTQTFAVKPTSERLYTLGITQAISRPSASIHTAGSQ